MTGMASTEKVDKKIEIPSDIGYIRKVSEEIFGVLEDLKIAKSIQFDVRLSVEEAVRNAIDHAHKHKKELPVNISYTADKNKIEIELEDRGEGFDPEKLPDPTVGENLLRGSGRGVLLIHKFMDEVKYNKK